jgi:hypothetical protein
MPFNPAWHSHKFNGPGLGHEVAVCIQSGEIVWINGPFPCGAWPDIRIARDALVYELDIQGGEMMLADGGHDDGYEIFETPTGERNADQTMKALARAWAWARHETVNGKLKSWRVLSQTYRHPSITHGLCFRAVANITQFQIAWEGTTFMIDCDDTVPAIDD